MAADETGAVYVVTDHRLLTLVADKAGYPQVRWSAAYDRGTRQKPGQLSQGSGTTPTLIGKDLVAITDNAEPRMNVLVLQARRQPEEPADLQGAGLRQPAPPRPRTASSRPGSSVIVENNYGYEGPQSTVGGADHHARRRPRRRRRTASCHVAWTSNVIGADLGAEGLAGQRPALRLLQEGRRPRSTTAGTSPRSTSAPAAPSGPSAPATASSGTTTTRRSTSARTVRRTCPRWPAWSGSRTADPRPGRRAAPASRRTRHPPRDLGLRNTRPRSTRPLRRESMANPLRPPAAAVARRRRQPRSTTSTPRSWRRTAWPVHLRLGRTAGRNVVTAPVARARS